MLLLKRMARHIRLIHATVPRKYPGRTGLMLIWGMTESSHVTCSVFWTSQKNLQERFSSMAPLLMKRVSTLLFTPPWFPLQKVLTRFINSGENQNEGTLAHIDQKIVHRTPKSSFRDGTWVSANSSCPPSFLFVDAKSIEGPCIAVPDVLSPNSANEFFILCPVNEWSSLFEDSASEWGETKII